VGDEADDAAVSKTEKLSEVRRVRKEFDVTPGGIRQERLSGHLRAVKSVVMKMIASGNSPN